MGRIVKRRQKHPLERPSAYKFGFFTARNVKLREMAINNLVLRVPLTPYKKKPHKQMPTKNHSSTAVKKTPDQPNRISTPVRVVKLANGQSGGAKKPQVNLTQKSTPVTTVTVKTDTLIKPKRRNTPVKPDIVQIEVTDHEPSARSPKTKRLNTPARPEIVRIEVVDTKNCTPKTVPKRVSAPFKTAKVESELLLNGQKFRQPPITKKTPSTVRTPKYYSLKPCLPTKLTVDFDELSELVNLLKMPSPSWQATVMMKHDFSTAFKFATRSPPKCVTFSQRNPNCKIFMGGTPIALLGCPKTIDTLKEIEILLDIVHRLDFKDCMVVKL